MHPESPERPFTLLPAAPIGISSLVQIFRTSLERPLSLPLESSQGLDVFRAQDEWAHFLWHTREAQALNLAPLRLTRFRTLRRVFRKQGRLNRMLLIAAGKAAILLPSQIFTGAHEQSDRRKLAGSLSRTLEEAWTLHRRHARSTPLLQRAKRPQNLFNQKLNEALRLLHAALLSDAFRLPTSSAGTAQSIPPRLPEGDWEGLSWHIAEAHRLNQSPPQAKPIQRRLLRNQEEINRVHAIALHIIYDLMQERLKQTRPSEGNSQ